MTKSCFNCQEDINKPEEGKCLHCGVEFDLKFDEPNDIVQKQIDRAVTYKRAGEFEKSIKIYELLNSKFPNDPIIYASWAKALVSSGNYDLGCEYFVKAKKLFEFFDKPTSIVGEPIKTGGVLRGFWTNNVLNCKEYIDLLLHEPRNSEEFLHFLKRISGNQNYEVNFNSVVDHINTINVLNNNGLALYHRKEYEQAIKIFDEALKINPNNIIVLHNKANALHYSVKYQYQDEVNVYDEILHIEPGNVIYLSLKAQVLTDLGREQDAIDLCDKILEIGSENLWALFWKAINLEDLKRYKDAVDVYNKILTIKPGHQGALDFKSDALKRLV